MDPLAILDLVMKGVQVIKVLVDAAQDAGPAIKAVENLVTGAQAGTLTQDQIDETEKILDGMISDFNEPLPPDDE